MYIQDGKSLFSLIVSLYGKEDIGEIDILIDNWMKNNHQSSNLDLFNLVTEGKVIIKEGELFQIPSLSLEEAKSLASDLKSKYGLEIRDRWYRMKRYRQCFIGTELVNCLTKNKNILKEEAIFFGQELFRHGLIQHVCNDHDFKDQLLFYHFQNE